MCYERIDSAIAICESHIATLDSSSLVHKEVETYIVAGLVVLMVSEYEKFLESLFVQRAEICNDGHACNYIKMSLSDHFRSPDLSKINQTLKRFDESCLAYFKSMIENTAQHAAWDSLLIARHAVVHKKSQLNITFRELKENYPLTKQVITHVEYSLGLSPLPPRPSHI